MPAAPFTRHCLFEALLAEGARFRNTSYTEQPWCCAESRSLISGYWTVNSVRILIIRIMASYCPKWLHISVLHLPPSWAPFHPVEQLPAGTKHRGFLTGPKIKLFVLAGPFPFRGPWPLHQPCRSVPVPTGRGTGERGFGSSPAWQIAGVSHWSSWVSAVGSV